MSARLLLVEDNELNRDLLKRRLTRKGYEVITAVDGEEGIQKVREHKPDLVLLDLDLPKIDGWTAAKLLKADADTSSIPVLALTAHAMVGDREKALAAGCDDYDVKPVEFARLLSKIKALLASGSDGG
jgi:CheY-like chemotaxis protein